MPKKSVEQEAKKAIADAKALLNKTKRLANAWQKAKATAYLIEKDWPLHEIWLHLASDKNLQATFDEAEQAENDRIREKAYRLALQIVVMLTSDSDQQSARLTVTKAAKVAQTDTGTISREIRAGRLKSNGQRGHDRRISSNDLLAWLMTRKGIDPADKEAMEEYEAIRRKLGVSD